MEKRLLIIENDLEMEDIFKEIFSEASDEVFFYEETDNIFKLIELHRPNLIILDYNLNGTNGGELCKRIKSDKAYSHIPILMLSAFPKFIYRNESVDYDAFLEKPFDVEEFKMIVEEKIMNGSSK
ncbi:DNA-binding response OmpR family regulator [Pedobacter sp. CG_S7]|uniref:response regulator n=1 Tax=Pedobacter sp. CG_S7 TaxID=3143930 RepID=UPI00339AC411